MRILTYTSLRSIVKGVDKGAPLKLEIEDFEIIETDMQINFLRSILLNIEWQAVCLAADALGLKDVPAIWNEDLLDDKDFMTAMHQLLLDIHVKEGILTCPESGREFRIVKGIPNML
jgi:multifunctional methyltransferase subunit TRM112